MAKGLDCGTSYYISATENSIKKQRNVFLTVDGDANQVKRMLKRQRIPFVEKAGKVHIVGQHAFNYAQIFSTTDLKRPMSQGLLNPKEKDALPVLNAIIGELVGKAKGGTMKIRKSNPEARKSFRARHNCDNPGPRHKARYWSCRKW